MIRSYEKIYKYLAHSSCYIHSDVKGTDSELQGTAICLVFGTVYPMILKEVLFSTDNLRQSAIFYKILSLN